MKAIFLIVASLMLALSVDVHFSLADMPAADELHLIRAKFYVWADGDDKNEGNSEKPFKTIERAQKAVRDLNLRPDPKGNWQYVLVLIRGNLTLDKTIVFGPEDSAPDHTTFCYASENENDAAKITGGNLSTKTPGGQNHTKLLNKLVVIKGTSELPIRGLEFHRLDLSHGNGIRPETVSGSQEKRVITKNLNLRELDGIVDLEFARDIQFQDCDVHESYGDGLSLGDGCKDCYVNRCRFFDINYAGILIGNVAPLERKDNTGQKAVATDSTPHLTFDPRIPSRIQVRKCLFEHGNGGYIVMRGISIQSASHTWIRQNVFRDFVAHAIYIDADQPMSGESHSHHLITENHIYRHASTFGGAAILIKGKQPGTIVRLNRIHDLNMKFPKDDESHKTAREMNIDIEKLSHHAIALVDSAEGVMVENNTIYNVSGSPFRISTNGKNIFKQNRLVVQRGHSAFRFDFYFMPTIGAKENPKFDPQFTTRIDNTEIIDDGTWKLPPDDPAIDAGYSKYDEKPEAKNKK